MPGYVEWALAFPRAPRGSVSVQIWGIACATVIQLVGQAVVAAWVLAVGMREGREKQAEGKEKRVPVAMKGAREGGGDGSGGGGVGREKKEL